MDVETEKHIAVSARETANKLTELAASLDPSTRQTEREVYITMADAFNFFASRVELETHW